MHFLITPLTHTNLHLLQPTPAAAQFGVPGNRRKGGAASFEDLNKMAAERMAADDKKGAAGALGDMDLSALGDMDLGALMKDIDPNTLQELMMEGMKDPAIQEMVSVYLL